VFNIAHEEVINYFIWRQQDAQRNSVQMYARSMFSHNQCTGKSCEELKSMMWTEHGKAWGELDARWRNGFCVTKNEDGLHANIEIPTFVNDREFVTQFV
jgi:tRNA(His) 5'-end guanylyltransferase